MNTRAFTLALVIALIAIFMIHTYVEDEVATHIKKYGTSTSVVVAKVDIKELELIDDSKITMKSIPEDFLAPGHFKDIRDLDNTVASVPIKAGEQITQPRVTAPGPRTGLARQVSLGKRAITLNISESQSVGKLIRPGDRVDLVASIDYASSRKDMIKVKTILQDVLVLSTGKNMTNSIPMIGVKDENNIGDAGVVKKMNLNVHTNYSSVTLEVDPYEAQKLIFLLKNLDGTPYLILRNNNDKKLVRIQSTKVFDVLGDDAAEAKSYFQETYDKKK